MYSLFLIAFYLGYIIMFCEQRGGYFRHEIENKGYYSRVN